MTQRLRIVVVDVFAEKPLAGNQLAVVLGAADLTEEQMQLIAREMNFSETTFVLREAADEADVRIFTPASELPFAGHPTLGTAWVLTAGARSITLNLAGGRVPVDFVDGVAWMTPPPVEFKEPIATGDAAALLGLSESDLNSDFSVAVAVVGPGFLLVPLKDLSTLKGARFNLDLLHEMTASGVLDKSVDGVFAFSSEPYDATADFASRMFFEAGDAREDPATGSANACFAAYLKAAGGGAKTVSGASVVVDQGVEILRPSRLYLNLSEPLQVGGKVQPVLDGVITI
ncbi:MAG: PhzF family phenazine biosynthesis protein [Pseudomonadaceae bacterium]|nr:PhzF family phenazine biosynthesis protein [Pseudomonadaceae bacterium]